MDNARGDRSTRALHWVLHQLHGLSEGLEKLHSMNCRHGDLKPENILCFQEEAQGTRGWGTLAIADMGIAKVHNTSTVERSRGTATKAGTIKYEHPEAMWSSSRPTSRRADIWSFGCIMVELVVWLLYGYDEIERFDGAFARYFDIVSDESVVSPVVVKWMDYIELDPRCREGTVLRDVLELARKRLLVPEQSNGQKADGGALVKSRADAMELHYALRDIVARANRDDKYFDKGSWSGQDRLTGPND
jgi:serine/threonine protein kinase